MQFKIKNMAGLLRGVQPLKLKAMKNETIQIVDFETGETSFKGQMLKVSS